MSTPHEPVEIAFRIPGDWSHPRELVERLPEGYRITGEHLIMPDGTQVDFIPMQADTQFPGIFQSSCRQEVSDEVLAKVNRYTVNVGLAGPGGSMEAALTMMQAAAAIVQAGAAGVFIDNCGMAHGDDQWQAMVDDGGSDALSFAFVSVISGKQDIWTMGFHALGHPEFVMRRTDPEVDAELIIEAVRYVARGEKPIHDGDLLGDELGPRFQATATDNDERVAGSPMHNPFGRLRLVSLKDIAEGN